MKEAQCKHVCDSVACCAPLRCVTVEFTLVAEGWTDEARDLPLRYTFAFNVGAPASSAAAASPEDDFPLAVNPSLNNTITGVVLPTSAAADGKVLIGTFCAFMDCVQQHMFLWTGLSQ